MQAHQIAGPELALDSHIEQRDLPNILLQLNPDSDCPDLPLPEARLPPDEFALVARNALCRGIVDCVHTSLRSCGDERGEGGHSRKRAVTDPEPPDRSLVTGHSIRERRHSKTTTPVPLTLPARPTI